MKTTSAAALLAGCLGLGAAQAAPLDCVGPPPQLALDKITARAIIVGEVHGTAETPAFVGQVVCGLLKSGRPVILALERDGSEQVALNRYLASAGQPADVQALTSAGAWAQAMQDGRNSRAMLALIEQVRQWKQAGQRVGLLAMQQEYHDIVPPSTERVRPTQADLARFSMLNDRAMADKTWTALTANPAYTVVALAGNVHTAIGSKSRAQFEASPSFADLLADTTPVHVIGLDSAGGSSWNMTSDGKPGPRSSIPGPLFMPDSRIDSRIDLGKISASPPAGSN